MTKFGTETISSYTKFLECVNNDLREVIVIATSDHAEAYKVLQELHAQTQNCEKNQPGLDGLDLKVEGLLSGLQYLDMFSQRVEHLIKTHERMITTPLARNFESSFFHLHVFQSMTIELDLLKSTESIKALLGEIKDCHIDDDRSEWLDQVYFGQTAIIKTILRRTVEASALAGGDQGDLPIPTLTIDQVHLLNSL